MSIFTDIYNTVAKFFRQSEEPVIGEASKAVAANRLRLVLMQDRASVSPDFFELMKKENPHLVEGTALYVASKLLLYLTSTLLSPPASNND